jgi:Flp pilus assembly protein TadG
MEDPADDLCRHAFGGQLMRQRERGALIVEFAVTLPVLMLLTLIAAEGANLFRVFDVIDNAAREGVRLSILPQDYYQALNQGAGASFSNPTTCTFTPSQMTSTFPVCQSVANYLQNNGIVGTLMVNCPSVTVTVDQQYAPASDTTVKHYSKVSAVCAYSLKYLPRLPFYSIPRTISIKRSSTMLNLY